MTDMGNKVLVSVAPVAATDKVIIPEKIAEDVYDCYKAGAAMVHLHVRDREGNLTPDMTLLEETLAMIPLDLLLPRKRILRHFNQVVCSDIHAHYNIYFVACLLSTILPVISCCFLMLPV